MKGWISRTGIGYSWGFPGFRVGVAADGRRYLSIGIPGTGLYFYKYFRRSQPARTSISQQTGGQIPGVPVQHRPPPTGTPSTPTPTTSNAPLVTQQPWWKQKNLP
jgi:hypothetical protein